MITREGGDNVYISVNELADGDDHESGVAHQTSLRLSRVMEQSSIRDTSRDFITMKDYLIRCGYQADSRVRRALLQILEDNGVEDIMDMVDFAKGFLPWLRMHGSQYRSMDLVKLPSFIQRTCGESVSLSFSELQNVLGHSSQKKASSSGPREIRNAHDQQPPNPETSEHFHTPPHSPKGSLDRPAGKASRRSDIFRPGDLAYNNTEESRPYGSLPSLNLR